MQATAEAPVLTIVVPTYNRPDKLRRLMASLLPQRDLRWRLLIIDNHSDTPMRDILPPDIEVVRNRANIGLFGNISRCLESVETDWVWICGDDDVIEPDGVQQVMAAIAQYPDAAVLNFPFPGRERTELTVCNGLDEFLDRHDSFASVLWITGNVYARRHYWPYMSLGYTFAGGSPHFVMSLMAMAKGASYIMLPVNIAKLGTDGGKWNIPDVILLTTIALDLPLTKGQRRKLANLMTQRGLVRLRTDIGSCSHLMQHYPNARYETLYLFFKRWFAFGMAQHSIGTLTAATLAGSALAFAPTRMLVNFIFGMARRRRGISLTLEGYVVERFTRL